MQYGKLREWRRGRGVTRVLSTRICLSGPYRSRGTSSRARALHRAGRPFQRLHHGPLPFATPVTGGWMVSSPSRSGRTVSVPLPRGLPVPLTGPRCRGVHGVSSPFTRASGRERVPGPHLIVCFTRLLSNSPGGTEGVVESQLRGRTLG